MLSRSSRIPRELFPSILASRSFKNSPHFSLRVGQSEGKSPKIAVSVSKKVAKLAVNRNTTRRRAYSALQSHIIKALAPGLYLFTAKSGADKLRGESLKNELSELLNSYERA